VNKRLLEGEGEVERRGKANGIDIESKMDENGNPSVDFPGPWQ
jgi:hypothetical protein